MALKLKRYAIFFMLTSFIASINTKPAVPERNVPEAKAAPEAELGKLVMEQKCPPPCRMKPDATIHDCDPPWC